ncbi:hypothetical protein P885DRAFT_77012 [Corynascus similis CBS 632.67]
MAPDRDELRDPLECTTWIVDKLRRTRYNKVAAYLTEHTEVKRLFEPATYFIRNKRVQASWNIDRAERALALVVYMLRRT